VVLTRGISSSYRLGGPIIDSNVVESRDERTYPVTDNREAETGVADIAATHANLADVDTIAHESLADGTAVPTRDHSQFVVGQHALESTSSFVHYRGFLFLLMKNVLHTQATFFEQRDVFQ
jgi:hypothetical protein